VTTMAKALGALGAAHLVDGFGLGRRRGGARSHGAAGRSGTGGVAAAGGGCGLVDEIGLLAGVPRTATVTALEPSRLLQVDGHEFVDSLSLTPAAPTLLAGATDRLAGPTPRTQASPARRAAVARPDHRYGRTGSDQTGAAPSPTTTVHGRTRHDRTRPSTT
jgi:hypothetical protein